MTPKLFLVLFIFFNAAIVWLQVKALTNAPD